MAKVKILYIGRRKMGDDTTGHAFIYKGEEIYFTKAKWVEIGELYIAESGKKNSLSMVHRPEHTGKGEYTEDQYKEWCAKDAAAAQWQRRKASAVKVAKHKELVEIAARLKPFLKSLSWSQKRDVVEFILDELEKESRAELSRKMSADLNGAIKRAFKRGALSQKTKEPAGTK